MAVSSSSTMTWQVEYARFMVNPPCLKTLRSPHPFLQPGNSRTHARFNGGEWLTNAASKTAVAKLLPSTSSSFVLVVSLNHRIMEEHSVMKLHFSWAQMSCASQSAVRGSRAIFASFKDSAGQVQKFAMRFLNSFESQSFINTLKGSLKYSSTVGTLSNNSSMNMQSEGRLTTIAEEVYVNTEVEDDPHLNTVNIPVPLSFVGVESASHEETTLFGANQGSNLPPSVTNFLTSCCTEARQDAAELQQVTDEFYSEYSFARYMSGSSFNAMLSKLDKVISDLGGDLAL